MSNRRRPFLGLFAAQIGGFIFAQSGLANEAWLVLSAIVFTMWLVAELCHSTKASILLVVVIILGTVLRLMPGAQIDWKVVTHEGPFWGTIVEKSMLEHTQRLIVQVEKPVGRVAVHVGKSLEGDVGDQFRFIGQIEVPEMNSNPGELSYGEFLARQDVHGLCYPKDYGVVDKAQSRKILSSIASYLRRNIEGAIDRPGLILALVLGDRTMLSEDENNLRRLGINHLLAISGMHIGMIALVLGRLLEATPLSRPAQGVFGLFLLLGYVLVTGGRPSAWRALFVCALAWVTRGLNRPVDGKHIWSMAGFCMLLISPRLVGELGFQLSFAASGGIIFSLPIISKVGSKISRGLLVSLAAQSAIIPFLAVNFGELALLSPLFTLLFVPLALGLLVVGMAVGLLGPWIGILGWVGNQLVTIIRFAMGVMGNWAIVIPISTMSMIFFLSWYIVLFLILLRIGSLHVGRWPQVSWSWILIGVLTLILINTLPPMFIRPLEITFLDVGQGDSILVRTPMGQNILVDGGGDSQYWQQRGRDVGRDRLVPYLKRRGIDFLDLVVLSHPHEDHLFGLLAVLGDIDVGMIMDNGDFHTTESYTRYLEQIMEREIPYYTVRKGASLEFRGGVRLEVLHPPYLLTGTGSDFNNNSVVLRIRYQGRSIILTGDIDRAGQEVLVKNTLGKADLVKVPHHGSAAALLPELYEQTTPRYAVISVGKNSYGHPASEVTDYLQENRIRTLRTDKMGAITFYVFGGLTMRRLW